MTALRHERENKSTTLRYHLLAKWRQNRVEIQHYICSVCRQLEIQNSEQTKPNNKKPWVILLWIISLGHSTWRTYACSQEVSPNPLSYFLIFKSFSNTLPANLQTSLFYSLTSYFYLNMDHLILFCATKSSRFPQTSAFVNKTKVAFFPVTVFFLNLLGDFVDRFFPLKVLWDTFGERTSAWQCLTKHTLPSQFSQVRVRGQVALKREHMHMEESLPQQSSLLLEPFLTNQGWRTPEVFLKPFAIKLCNKAQVPIQAWQFCPLTTKGARITL